MIKFEKVSLGQFMKDCKSLQVGGSLWFSSDEEIEKVYNAIQLPRRGTPGSAGYDFFLPFPVAFVSPTSTTIPTGVRVILPEEMFLMCVPRSGLGFKYGMRLRNSTGIIDASYSEADNEGHIMAKIDTDEPFKLNAGDRFMQGIVLRYFVTYDDDPIQTKRTGGFGSTGGTGE